MSDYRPTRISSLHVRGYRSLKDVYMSDPGSCVVLHGPNGSGKSNLLRAIKLVFSWAARSGELPREKESAWKVGLSNALGHLDMSTDDFSKGESQEVAISITVDLGTRARELVGAKDLSFNQLKLEAVAQAPGDGNITCWFREANVDGVLELGKPPVKEEQAVRNQLVQLRQQERNYEVQREEKIELLTREYGSTNTSAHEAQLTNIVQTLDNVKKQIATLEGRLSQESLVMDRLRFAFLARRSFAYCDAYRHVIRPDDDVQFDRSTYKNIVRRLFDARNSEDKEERRIVRSLSDLFFRVWKRRGVLEAVAPEDPILPVLSKTHGSLQLRVDIPPHGDLPMEQLGTGEQQIFLMLADIFFSQSPIAAVEEPEAHLYKNNMESLADYFVEAIKGDSTEGRIDQLWLATHHHYFTLMPDYFDVSLDDEGWTKVERRKSTEAALHFYEPGPFWKALHRLVDLGMDEDAVLFHEEDGRPVTAGEVKESIEDDRRLAQKFVDSATTAAVLSMRNKAKSR